MRRHLATTAEAASLGRVRRVFRSRNSFTNAWVLRILAAALALGTILYFNAHPLLAAIVVLLALLGLGGYVYFGDPGEMTGRRWIAVAEGGLVVQPQHGSALVVPWHSIVELRADQLLSVGADGRAHPVPLGAMGGKRALIRSIQQRSAVPPPVLLRAVAGGVVAVAVGVAAWFLAVPSFVVRTADLPQQVGDMGTACERAGTRYPAAAPYGGAPPHPIAVFEHSEDGYEHTGPSDNSDQAWTQSGPQVVQLIACVERTGSEPYRSLQPCSYQEEFGLSTVTRFMDAGQYRITVFEARTHRKVTTLTVLGDDNSCPERISSKNVDLYSRISPSKYREVLDRVVHTTS